MLISRRLPIGVALLAALAPAARAQGEVQITFDGALEPPGGARVAVAVVAGPAERTREVRLDLHLAAGTSGADLAALLAARLQAAGLEALAPTPAGPRAHVFVEDARSVTLELGAGLGGAVTLCEGAPELVRVEPARGGTSDCRLVVAVSAMHAHTERRARSSFEVRVAPELTAAQVSERLFARAVEAEWVSERPGLEGWRPVHLSDGSRITGFSVELAGHGSWRVDVRLPEAP